jgi:hypothetical protein
MGLLDSDQADSRILFDDDDDSDQVHQDLAVDCEPINTDASIDLCIELGSGDMIE